MNKLEEAIARLEEAIYRTEAEEQLLMMLYEARENLEENADDEAAEAVLEQVRQQQLL